jgi:phage/plasmid-like protein (TIGR03299 family)
MMSVRETPWNGLGVTLDEHPESIDDAIKAAGLDWDVAQRPVLIPDGDYDLADFNGDEFGVVPIEGYYANVREDTGAPLGIVTSRYRTVANREAFSFLSTIFGSEMHFETAGSLMGGRRVWVMLKIPSWIEIGGDQIGQYALVSNSHDGKSSVMLAVTPVRIICQNMLVAALRSAQRTYTIRHLGNPSLKLAEARRALEVTTNFYTKFQYYGDKMALRKLSDADVKRYVETLIPVTDDLGERAMRNREEVRQSIQRLYRNGTTVDGISTVGNAPGTTWAIYNAAAEFADWYRNERKTGGRFQRAIDDPDGLKQRAWQIALEMTGLN